MVGPDWATDVHMIIPQAQARDPAVLNTWLPTFADILSHWKWEEHLGVCSDCNGTSCTVWAQSRLTLCDPMAHATSTHIFKGEKCSAGAASLAQLIPLTTEGDLIQVGSPCPCPPPHPTPQGAPALKGVPQVGRSIVLLASSRAGLFLIHYP